MEKYARKFSKRFIIGRNYYFALAKANRIVYNYNTADNWNRWHTPTTKKSQVQFLEEGKMKWIKYQLYTTTDYAETIGGLLCEAGINGYEITDHVPLSEKEERQMYTDIPADTGFDDGSSVLSFYTEAPGNTSGTFFSTGSSLRDGRLEDTASALEPGGLIEKIKSRIKDLQKFIPVEMPEITYSVEDDSQWKDKWKENFKPFRIASNIIIKPEWEELPEDIQEEDIVIEINPGSAFGTGTHETTKLCLLSLKDYITPGIKILDAGCGSGILAISALLCGAGSALCLDIDPSAVAATLENAKLNNISQDRLKVLNANILEDEDIIIKNSCGSFDIAVANILADVIILLAGCIGKFIKNGGLFISSGILAEKAGDVEEALIKNHFQILQKNTLKEWTSFVARNISHDF